MTLCSTLHSFPVRFMGQITSKIRKTNTSMYFLNYFCLIRTSHSPGCTRLQSINWQSIVIPLQLKQFQYSIISQLLEIVRIPNSSNDFPLNLKRFPSSSPNHNPPFLSL